MKIPLGKFTLFILAGAIALSPSFSIGKIGGEKLLEIRAEDIILLIFGLLFIFIWKLKMQKPPFSNLILVWIGIGLFSTLVNWLIMDLSLGRGFFYLLKEVEFFFLYFFVFNLAKNSEVIKSNVNFWFFLASCNIFYVLFQFFIGYRGGEYGMAAIGEWGVFPTGSLFLIFFVFLFNFFLYEILHSKISKIKKIIMALMAVGAVIGVFASLSKTIFLALVFSVLITFLLLFFKNNKKIIFTVAIGVILVSFIFISMAVLAPEMRRITDIMSFGDLIESFIVGRGDVISAASEKVLNGSYFLLIVGMGKGFVGEAHNQYLHNFIETGVFGIIIFLILIFAILKKSFLSFINSKDSMQTGLSAGFFIATLTMLFTSIAAEAFLAVKPNEIYWFFAALAMATVYLNKKNNIYGNEN